MSLDLILLAIAGGGVTMPPTLLVDRSDSGSPAEFQLGSDGVLSKREGSSMTVIGPWVSPGSAASLYEVRSTVTSGSFTSDPSAGSWISLSSTRLWSRGASVGGSQTVIATIEIRIASSGTVVSTTTLTMTCDRT